MNLIDLHCDTIWKMMDLDKKGDLLHNECSVNIPNMKRAGTLVQCFACFIYLADMEGDSEAERVEAGYRHAIAMTDYLKQQVERYGDCLFMACKKGDIVKNRERDQISALLTLEEGAILNGCLERLDELYCCGIRMAALIWNHENCIGFPNSRDPEIMKRGLKPFGIEAIRRMEELGMLIDVSHTSDGGFWDYLKHTKKPVLASHSNCRAVTSHPRNLSDEMIRALAERGGIAGLNFYGPFLGRDGESCLDEMAEHLLHMIKIGGSEFPAIGTDFDGFDGMRRMDIPDTAHMYRLLHKLEQAGLTSGQIDKIWSGNALRVLGEVC